MLSVLSRKNTISRGIKFVYLFIFIKEFNQLFFKKILTKFELDRVKVELLVFVLNQ